MWFVCLSDVDHGEFVPSCGASAAEILSFHVPFRPGFLFGAAVSLHTCPTYANAHSAELLVGLIEYLADAIVTFGIPCLLACER